MTTKGFCTSRNSSEYYHADISHVDGLETRSTNKRLNSAVLRTIMAVSVFAWLSVKTGREKTGKGDILLFRTGKGGNDDALVGASRVGPGVSNAGL